MREYGSVSPRFWIGETGKRLRGDANAQVLALYLMTSPHANMIGVFHCPVLYMAHETGLDIEGASKALARLIEAGFCKYERDSETVFVIRMAAHQVGERLKRDDKRVLGIRKELEKISDQSLKAAFVEVYAESFHLEREPLASPLIAPPKQLTGTGTGTGQEGAPSKPTPSRKVKVPIPDDFTISDRVRAWASEKGYGRLDEHLEAFARKCRSNGYTKLNWDDTFMEAIREDWAKLRAGPRQAPPPKEDPYAGAL